MKSYTLYELNEHIKRVIALNYQEALWINCEIAQISLSRGHCYLQLIQKQEDRILAEANAIIWNQNYQKLKRKIGKDFNSLLQAGVNVLIQVRLDFSERYGLKLIVQDIDVGFTIGQAELKRRAIIEQLEEENLLQVNKQLELPLVLQNIAVISSPNAAGFADFSKQLEQNAYGYVVNWQLFPSAMQGVSVERELNQQLQNIQKDKTKFDAIVIIRGGGAKLDLAAFDNYAIAKSIALSPLPVITGIGHEIDTVIADLVAHTSLKTPTAAADFILQSCLRFEATIQELVQMVYQTTRKRINENQLFLEQIHSDLQFKINNRITSNKQVLHFIEEQLPEVLTTRAKLESMKISNLEQVLDLLTPEKVLQRGYTITLKDGTIVKDANLLEKGMHIETVFNKGSIKSIVKETNTK